MRHLHARRQPRLPAVKEARVNWKPRAALLASEVAHPASRWRPVVAAVPRHAFAPRWWAWAEPGLGLWHDTWDSTIALPILTLGSTPPTATGH